MVFLILIPVFLLPAFLILYYLYQKVFEGNLLMLWLGVFIIFLAGLVIIFYQTGLDEKLSLRTSTYGISFNDIRTENNLPLLTYEFTQDGKTWNTKADSVSDPNKFILVQKTIEENDEHTAADLEFNFLAKALSDTTVLYLKIQYNFLTKNYYAETTIGNLKRPSYRLNKLRVFDDCCSRKYKRAQVDSLLREQ